MEKFGHPDTLIHDYADRVVLLHNDQITLSALVVAEKSAATSLSAVVPHALAELASITGDVETAFVRTIQPDKFNYLVLMMVDPDVHLHVLLRYSGARECAGVTFEDRACGCAAEGGHRVAARRAQLAAALIAGEALPFLLSGYANQFSTLRLAKPAKSSVLRVIKVKSFIFAIAAIWPSA